MKGSAGFVVIFAQLYLFLECLQFQALTIQNISIISASQQTFPREIT